MNRKGILNIVRKTAEPLAEELNYELVDIEFVRESSNYYLRVFLDKLGGISLDDCQKMSQLLSEKLDAENPIDVPYYLEVSSPGLDRPLKNDKDLRRNIGKWIDVRLYSPLEGKKTIEGILDSYNEESIFIEVADEEKIEISKESIALIKLVVKF